MNKNAAKKGTNQQFTFANSKLQEKSEVTTNKWAESWMRCQVPVPGVRSQDCWGSGSYKVSFCLICSFFPFSSITELNWNLKVDPICQFTSGKENFLIAEVRTVYQTLRRHQQSNSYHDQPRSVRPKVSSVRDDRQLVRLSTPAEPSRVHLCFKGCLTGEWNSASISTARRRLLASIAKGQWWSHSWQQRNVKSGWQSPTTMLICPGWTRVPLYGRMSHISLSSRTTVVCTLAGEWTSGWIMSVWC